MELCQFVSPQIVFFVVVANYDELFFTRSSCSKFVLTVGKYVGMYQMVHGITVDIVFRHFAADNCERNGSVIRCL